MPAPTCTGAGCPDEASSVVPTHEAGIAHPDADPADDAPATDPDAAQSDALDASPDAAPPTTLRCGGGDLGDASQCAAPNPLCCMRTEEDGGVKYACSAPFDCSGSNDHPISCAGPEDCASGFVCCHFKSSTTCVEELAPDGAPGHCLDGQHGGSLVCDHSSFPDLCPPGSTCSVPLDIDNVYYACSM
jgi:hypothetical protein